MGTFIDDANLVHAAVGDRQLVCRHCDGIRFGMRRIKLNTSGAEFFGFAWANRESLGYICDGCGAIEEFLEGVIQNTPVPL